MPSSQVWELFIGAKELWWIREWFEWCLIMSDAPLRISNHFLSIIRDNKEQTTKKWFYQICASFTTIMETEESGAGIVFCVFDISNQRWVEDNWIESKWPLIIPSAEHMVTCHQQVSGGVILIMMVMRVMIHSHIAYYLPFLKEFYSFSLSTLKPIWQDGKSWNAGIMLTNRISPWYTLYVPKSDDNGIGTIRLQVSINNW